MRKLQGQNGRGVERKQRCVLTASSALFPFFGSLSFVQRNRNLRRIAHVYRVVRTEMGVTPLALLQGKKTVYSACVDSVKCATSTRARSTRKGRQEIFALDSGALLTSFSSTRGVY
ncbi:hypothetical protein QQF64_022768 [Cirrhinus molitorella]|uniref:Uncharacterized protein n=1 Tax=Cirrhinus molitorella TaxID=172907 RepID=A0ABR3L6W5_9TELE